VNPSAELEFGQGGQRFGGAYSVADVQSAGRSSSSLVMEFWATRPSTWPAPWWMRALGPSLLLRAGISKDAAGGALPAGCIPPLPRSTAMRLSGSMVTEMPFWVFPGNRCWTPFRHGSIRLCGDAAVLQKHGAPEAGRSVPPDRQSN